jgi:hypothetical protein
MYKLIFDMVYAYTETGDLKLVGHLNELSLKDFLMIHRDAFIN